MGKAFHDASAGARAVFEKPTPPSASTCAA